VARPVWFSRSSANPARRASRLSAHISIALARDRQDFEARQAAAVAQQAEAATNIQRIMRGNKGRINAALLRNEKRTNARNIRREQEALAQHDNYKKDDDYLCFWRCLSYLAEVVALAA
jgi:hypothetical protein